MLLPIDTQFDLENGTLFAEVDELGTYCIMDMEIWLKNLGVAVPIPENDDTNVIFTPSPKFAPKRTSPESSSSWTPIYVSAPIDMVFILQVAGNSKDYFEEEKKLIQEFSQYVFNNNSNVNIYVITYTESNGNILKNSLGSYPFMSLAELTASLNNVSYASGVYDYCDRGQAFSLLLNTVHLRENADTFVYQLMNGANISRTESDNIQITNKVKANIITAYSEIGTPSWHYDYTSDQIRISTDIANNGDLFLSISDETLDALIEHFERKKSAQQPVYEILLPTNWKKVQLEGELLPGNNIDTDKDALTDWEETDTERLIWNQDGSFDFPVFDVAAVVLQLKRFDSDFSNDLFSTSSDRYYLPIISDPTLLDSDGDGADDENDPDPLIIACNYFIYYERPNNDPERSMRKAAYWMADYAYDNQRCCMLKVTTFEDFVDAWNNKIPNSANTIHLYLHGGIESLEFYGQSVDWRFYLENNAIDLKKVKVFEKVYLNSCNGATLYEYQDYSESMATHFSRLCPSCEIVALKDDLVVFFRITKYTQIPTITALDVFLNINNYYNVYIPVAHEGKGIWVSVTYDEQNDICITKEIGDTWRL